MKSVFGEITEAQEKWLNQELFKVGFGKRVSDLNGLPSFTENGKTKLYDFVYKFFKYKKANELNWQSILDKQNEI